MRKAMKTGRGREIRPVATGFVPAKTFSKNRQPALAPYGITHFPRTARRRSKAETWALLRPEWIKTTALALATGGATLMACHLYTTLIIAISDAVFVWNHS